MTLERPHYLCFQLKKMVCVAFLNQDTPHRRPPSAENTDSPVFPEQQCHGKNYHQGSVLESACAMLKFAA